METFTDYTLASRALLADYRAGAVTRGDICDAHPELLRAAENLGEPQSADCPVCGEAGLVRVAYAFGRSLGRRNGRAMAPADMADLPGARDVRCYVVEVCGDCGWNHLTRAYGSAAPEAGTGARAEVRAADSRKPER